MVNLNNLEIITFDSNNTEAGMDKLNVKYIKNGIYPGDKLISTYETEKCVMDFKVVDEIIEKYLMH